MAGLSLLTACLVVLAGVVTWVVIGGHDGQGAQADGGPYVVPSVVAPTAQIQPVGAAQALVRLQQAIRRDDRATAVSLAGADDPATGDLLGDLVDTASAAHLVDVTFRYVDEQGGLDADDVWSAAVDTTWRFAGFDSAPATSEVSFSFRTTPDGVRIAAVGGPQLRTPVWMSGPVQVERTRQTLVLVAGESPTLAKYAGYAARAVPIVRRVVTTWRPRLVVEVPVGLDGLDRALAEQPGADAAIAALASSVDGSSAPHTPVHILVNPDVFGPLPRLGAQVVMSHEVTHLATNAYESQAPTWLKEGIADFVALRDVRLPVTRTAGQIIAQVQRDGLPGELPTSADFDPQAPHLGSIYEAAWLICVTLAQRRDQEHLLQLYDATSRGADLDATLERLFGWSSADLLHAWRDRLSHLAG